MKIAAVLQRLQGIPGVDDLGVAVDIPSLQDQLVGNVGVYVVPLAEAGGSHLFGDGICEQEVRVAVGVVTGIRSLADSSGAQAALELEIVRDNIMSRLQGFKTKSAVKGLVFSAGALVNLVDRVMWWLDRYEVQVIRRTSLFKD